jgi:hypothetical protein
MLCNFNPFYACDFLPADLFPSHSLTVAQVNPLPSQPDVHVISAVPIASIAGSDLRNWRLWEVDNFSLISPRTPPTLARVSQADGEVKVHAQTLCSSQKVFCSLFFFAYPGILSRLSLGQWCTDRVFRDSLRFDFGCFDFSLPKLSQQTKHHWGQKNSMNLEKWRVDASCRNSIFRYMSCISVGCACHDISLVHWGETNTKCLPWFNLGLDAATLLQGQCFRLVPLWLVHEWSWKLKVTHHVWSLCHLTSRQFKASIAGVVCMFHTMFHYFWNIYFFDMNAFDRTARDDRQGSSWVVWVRPALAQPDRYSTVWASCGRHRSPSLPDVPWSIAYHALWLDRTNSSIPKKEIEKGDRRRATTVHSLAFPILSHPYVILMSWPCGRLSMTQLSYHVYHAFPEVFLTLVQHVCKVS